MRFTRNLINGLINIAFPKICHACKRKITGNAIDEVVCIDCWSKIKKNLPPFCYSCGRSVAGKKTIQHYCVDCIKNPLYFDRAFSPYVYDGIIKELIHIFKYGGKDYLAEILAKPMVEHIKEFAIPIDIIDALVPIPLSARKLREREFNQAAHLALPIARAFGKNISAQALLRSKDTQTQTELSDEERRNNVRGVFKAVPGCVNGKNILLVDDVLTTGATASEAAATLKNAGAKIVYVLTLAN